MYGYTFFIKYVNQDVDYLHYRSPYKFLRHQSELHLPLLREN